MEIEFNELGFYTWKLSSLNSISVSHPCFPTRFLFKLHHPCFTLHKTEHYDFKNDKISYKALRLNITLENIIVDKAIKVQG